MTAPTPSPYRQLPSVDRLLSNPEVHRLTETVGAGLTTEAARASLDAARKAIGAGGATPSMDEMARDIYDRVLSLVQPRPRRVINAAGVVIHTNLGRAPLSRAALEAAAAVGGSYSDLEYDLEAGERGSRHTHPERILTALTGAEAAIVVNNNASAVLLALSALAAGKEVIVSRGESIEIGGRFRIPDVMRQSGAKLVEVGTTNRTYPEDYEEAITPETAAILRVHRSNFALVGFTNTPEGREMADMAHRHGLPLINDLGSGCFLDTAKYGLAPEPTVREALAEGADLALFSGDKLLGGPQAGIAVGAKRHVDRLKRHPLARAVRIDKLDLAALTATLVSYLTGKAEQEIPVWQMISATTEMLERRARAWAQALGMEGVRVIESTSAIGGGSLPGETLPTRVLAVPTALCGPGGPEGLAARLRKGTPPVVARIADDMLLLDPRTVLPHEDEELAAALKAAL
jgi:L-seryl-tRNA(Ser) seleniumtransferase